jgi:hypothetical protein
VDLHSFCCPGSGSESVLEMRNQTQIRIGNGDPDQVAWKIIRFNKETWFPGIQKGFCMVPSKVCLLTVNFFKFIFHVLTQLFVILKSEQDPDPVPH